MEKPETAEELLKALKGRGYSPDQIAGHLKRLSTEREHFVEVPEVGSLDAIVAKLDKLQETVDRIAAKLDSESPA